MSKASILVLIHINDNVCYIFAAVRIEMDELPVLLVLPLLTENRCFNSHRLIAWGCCREYIRSVVAGDLLFRLLYYAKLIWAGGPRCRREPK
jgi:hypothetical protein